MTATEERIYLRTEREVAANAVWALIHAKVIPPTTPMAKLVQVTGVSFADLRAARDRAERVPEQRLKPQESPARAAEPAPPSVLPARVRHPEIPREDSPPPIHTSPTRTTTPPRLVPRARRECAERIFAEWRARGNLTCTRCGEPIYSGSDAVIEAAHHAEHCV